MGNAAVRNPLGLVIAALVVLSLAATSLRQRRQPVPPFSLTPSLARTGHGWSLPAGQTKRDSP